MTATETARRYAQDVIDGDVVAGRLVRLACERFFDDFDDGHRRGLRYDEPIAERAVAFFTCLHHYKGRWGRGRCSCAEDPETCPTRFWPEPWQIFVLASLYGWQRKSSDGWVRRYSTAYLQVARKQGKSFLAAGVGLYGVAADNEPSAEVYCTATKRDQARYVHDIAKGQIRASKMLRSRFAGWDQRLGNIYVFATDSKFEPLAADASTLDSLSPHVAIVDELHAHKTPMLRNVLWSGMGSREQPLLFQITTAGEDSPESVCKAERDYCVEVLEGRVEDDRYFAFIAEPDEGDEWHEEVAWQKANPNLGVSISLDDLAADAAKAQSNPVLSHEFRTKRCNLWDSTEEGLLDMAAWRECGRIEVDKADLRQRLCYGGLDLSSTQDLTAYALVFPPVVPDGSWVVRV